MNMGAIVQTSPNEASDPVSPVLMWNGIEKRVIDMRLTPPVIVVILIILETGQIIG